MSIYATGFFIVEPWPEDSPIRAFRVDDSGTREVSGGEYMDDEEERLGPPYVYGHSGVLPHANAERRGSVELGEIPGHIDRRGGNIHGEFEPQIAPQPDGDVPHPYLRLGIQEKAYTTNGETVVIDREQAKAMRDYLDHWLTRTEKSEPR